MEKIEEKIENLRDQNRNVKGERNKTKIHNNS